MIPQSKNRFLYRKTICNNSCLALKKTSTRKTIEETKKKKEKRKKVRSDFSLSKNVLSPKSLLVDLSVSKERKFHQLEYFLLGKRGKNTFQSHHDKTVSAYLFEGKDIHCFDKLCMNFTYADASISLCVMFQKCINFSSPVLESSHPN